MPSRKDPYVASSNPKDCGHPNVAPFKVSNGKGEKETHARCGTDDRPGCGEEWPK